MTDGKTLIEADDIGFVPLLPIASGRLSGKITPFRGGISIARFMVDLLHHHLLPVAIRQPGVTALAVPQQPEDAIWFPADNQLFRHAFLLFHSCPPGIRVKETFPFA